MTDSKAVPLYQQVKDYLASRISSGEWAPGHRVPSENELVRRLGASRMTVNRAVRELTADGLLRRVQGRGTYVDDGKAQSEMMRLRAIAEEIRSRGHDHRADVVSLEDVTAGVVLARQMELDLGSQVFHSVIVHYDNDCPVQLEDRYVNPAVAPGYLKMDFSSLTPNEYLMSVWPAREVENIVEAIKPDASARKLLRIGADEPCLLVRRRTWSGDHVATVARLIHPGSRYRLAARFAQNSA